MIFITLFNDGLVQLIENEFQNRLRSQKQLNNSGSRTVSHKVVSFSVYMPRCGWSQMCVRCDTPCRKAHGGAVRAGLLPLDRILFSSIVLKQNSSKEICPHHDTAFTHLTSPLWSTVSSFLLDSKVQTAFLRAL